jgi:hypothetical protein
MTSVAMLSVPALLGEPFGLNSSLGTVPIRQQTMMMIDPEPRRLVLCEARP